MKFVTGIARMLSSLWKETSIEKDVRKQSRSHESKGASASPLENASGIMSFFKKIFGKTDYGSIGAKMEGKLHYGRESDIGMRQSEVGSIHDFSGSKESTKPSTQIRLYTTQSMTNGAARDISSDRQHKSQFKIN